MALDAKRLLKNVGAIDSFLRYLLGVSLVLLGGVLLLRGSMWGLLPLVLSIFPFTFATTRSCPVFRKFGVHSLTRREQEREGLTRHSRAGGNPDCIE